MSNTGTYFRPKWAANMLSSQRLFALDLTKVLAMIMMIQGHTIDALLNPEYLNYKEFPWNVWLFARGFTAQVFLIVSGMVHFFANKRDENGRLYKRTAKHRIKISFALIIIGYLFSFPEIDFLGDYRIDNQFWLTFFRANILQLIGLTLILITILFLVTRSNQALGKSALVISIFIFTLSPFIHLVNMYDYLPPIFAGYLSFEHGSFFPIFPYSGYMFLGLYLGYRLKQIPPENRTNSMIKYFIPIGLLFLLIGYTLKYIFVELNFVVNFKTNYAVVIYHLGYIFIGISIISFLYTKMKNLSFNFSLFGKRSLMVYILHLILLYGVLNIPGIGKIYYNQLGITWTLVCVVFVEISTFSIVYLYEYLNNTSRIFQQIKSFSWISNDKQ